MFKSVLALAAVLIAAVAASGQFKSVYTPLSDTKCKTLESNPDEGGSYVGECEGAGGYKLHVIEGDLRQTVNVIAPGNKKFELRLWDHFGGFSAVGPRAEWRVKGDTPVALIIRFNVSENVEDASKTTSYLLVSKISVNEACVTAVVNPGKRQNIEARALADAALDRTCKTGRTLKGDR
jgi:hypothetical protein